MSTTYHHIINYLQLPPTTQSFNTLNQIKSLKVKQFTIFYIYHNNSYHLLYTYNHFKTFSLPITYFFTQFPSLQQLINSI